ncbi:nociceptin receptor-like [Diadema antillarum]|uniref:nociceptin receptor-like n=1 Tax=Diadema antillarum TaxID=105358 RepID=UPI003A8A7113
MDGNNSSYDSSYTDSDIEDSLNLVRRVNTTFKVAFSLSLFLTVIGLLANALVLFVILRDKKMRRAIYNVYVTNLCVASFILLFVWGGFDTVAYGLYAFSGHFLIHQDMAIQKGILGSQAAILMINSLTITVLALDRYFVIADQAGRLGWRTIKNARIVCAVIWAVGIFAGVVTVPIDVTLRMSVASKFSTTAFVLGYLVPLLVIAVSTGLTIRAAATRRRVQDSTVSSQKIKKKLRFLAVVCSFSLSFMICWGYWHAYFMTMWTLMRKQRFYRFNVITHMVLHMLCDIFILVNATLNPVLYVLTRDYLRRRVWSLLRCSSDTFASSNREISREAESLSTNVSSMTKTEEDLPMPARAAGVNGVPAD